MARINAQKAINNFNGGLVTEASQLSFPENSLSKAMNVTIKTDGSISSREAFDNEVNSFNFSSETFSSLFPADKSPARVKKYRWRERDGNVIVFFYRSGDNSNTEDYIVFVIIKDGVELPIKYSATAPYTLDIDHAIDYMDLAFTPDGFYFPVRLIEGSYTRSVIHKVDCPEDSTTCELSQDYTGIGSTATREPTTGYNYSYSTSPKYYADVYFTLEDLHCDLYWDNVKVYDGPWSGTGMIAGGYEYRTGTNMGNYTTSSVYHLLYAVYRYGESTSPVDNGEGQPIRYRDFKGVPNPSGTDTNYKTNHPPYERLETLSAFSAYNLYNAGWPRIAGKTKIVANDNASTVAYSSLLTGFVPATKHYTEYFPSMCDAPYDALIDQTDTVEAIGVYSPFLLMANDPVTKRARRGTNILTMSYEYAGEANTEYYKSYFYPFGWSAGSMLLDEFYQYADEQCRVPSSVTAMSIIGGRAWYGITGRDFNLAFSQINDTSDPFNSSMIGSLTDCYQANDPNAEIENDVLATDGGTLTISEMGTVIKILEYKNHILVFANNGIWDITGDESLSFKPTSYTIFKVSDDTISRNEGVLVADNVVYYVTDNDLKVITTNQSGYIEVADISSVKILSRMNEVAYLFNNSINSYIVFDQDDKRILVCYQDKLPTVSPSVSVPESNKYIHMCGMHSALIYDIRLNCFYEWEGSNDRMYHSSDSTIISIGFFTYGASFLDNTAQSLGWMYDRTNGLTAMYVSSTIYGGSGFTATYEGINPVFTQFSHTTGAHSRLDGPNNLVGNYTVEFTIPYDLMGDPSISKSIRTITYFVDSSSKYFDSWTNTSGSNILTKPRVYLKWAWDWDVDTSGYAELGSNIRYPEIVHYGDKNVITNKIKIPGSGRSLSMDFYNGYEEEDAGGFKLLGYYIDFNADNRP